MNKKTKFSMILDLLSSRFHMAHARSLSQELPIYDRIITSCQVDELFQKTYLI